MARRIWEERHQTHHLTGITIFNYDPTDSPETNLLRELATIDLHHGPLSADPPYMEIEVFGTVLTDRIRKALADYRFDSFLQTPDGFEAVRRCVPFVE